MNESLNNNKMEKKVEHGTWKVKVEQKIQWQTDIYL